MTKREQIIAYIEQEHFRVGFTDMFDYSPKLAFKLTNIDSKTNESFSVTSADEAEELVISFISTSKKGEIFTNDIYSEDKDLFLRVKTVLPKPL